jgi:alkylated DNA repair protein alkB family protein 1
MERKSAFKVAQGRYKRRPNDPDRVDDLHEVIDFHNPNSSHQTKNGRIRRIEPTRYYSSDSNENNDCIYSGPIYTLNDFYSGFLFFPAALSTPVQNALAYAAVRSYCEFPHVTNIHGVPPKPTENVNHTSPSMWEIWKQEQEQQRQQQQSNGNQILKRTMNTNQNPYYRCFRKLSWATMGYHYDWTERAYREQNQSPMPDELVKLGQLFAHTAAVLSSADTSSQHHHLYSYQPTACIVNYYDEKSVMGGHRDDLEQALNKPIVSISLGRPAIFLLGGKSLDEEPVLPILLRPGDVMILGGDCRLNYHSMARLLPAQLPTEDRMQRFDPRLQIQLKQLFGVQNEQTVTGAEKELLHRFLSDHRININLRQVYD